MFDFFSGLSNYANIAVDFLFGKKEYESGDVTGRESGVLGFLAQTYLESSKDSKEAAAPTMDVPKLGTSGFARGAGQAQGSTFVGQRNPAVETAIRRLMQGSANTQTSRFWQQYQTQMTTGQGRRTIGVSSPALPSVKVASAASVSTAKSETEV